MKAIIAAVRPATNPRRSSRPAPVSSRAMGSRISSSLELVNHTEAHKMRLIGWVLYRDQYRPYVPGRRLHASVHKHVGQRRRHVINGEAGFPVPLVLVRVEPTMLTLMMPNKRRAPLAPHRSP